MNQKSLVVNLGRLIGPILLLIGGVTAACGNEPATAVTPPISDADEVQVAIASSATPTERPVVIAPSATSTKTPVVIAPSATPTERPAVITPSATPTETPDPTLTPALVSSDESCIACHTSQERLITTADQAVEEVESLSEGEG